MTVGKSLTAELRAEVLTLQDDLRGRLTRLPDTLAEWKDEHKRAVAQLRTGQSWLQWSEDRITQAAVAWVLTTVFIRFCEDNELVAPVWFAGPRRRWEEATDAEAAFIRATARDNPDVTEREWLLQAVEHLRDLPATRALVDEHSPLWLIAPSGDAAAHLTAFWRDKDDSGGLRRDFTDRELDTRFLGDLYQDLSESARERFALLQTPEFVEELILDHTLTSALRSRKLDEIKIIDPTCGSGHFLLGAFVRVLERWHREAPGINERELVQRALDAIHGVDVNPFAVAIARFRLMVAAVKASGMPSLEDAPAFRFHLAVGDSLLHGRGGSQQFDLGIEYVDDRESAAFTYATENYASLQAILVEGKYDVVVGNPPYITVNDKALNARYRDLYNYCKGTYALTVPFMERFFALAKSGDNAGWVGQITSNSFMKREFGAPLIEDFLAKIDLSHVIDTSGAYIPGHGTPTVIVIGRNRGLIGSTVRAVLGVRGEPGRPIDSAKGKVWSSIAEHLDEPHYEDEWITVTDLAREQLAKHPWSLAGGGALELTAAIVAGSNSLLANHVRLIGRTCHTGSDDAYFAPPGSWRRRGVDSASIVPLVTGNVLRDWTNNWDLEAMFPYSQALAASLDDAAVSRHLWMHRAALRTRREPGGTHEEVGLTWYEWSRWHPERFVVPMGIAFAFVATHNHFVLDRGGKVFNRSAPVIKLPADATEDDHVALLGVLNSSTACFWLKQNSHNKGSTVDSKGARQTTVAWENFFEFTGTTLQDYPLAKRLPLQRGRELDRLSGQLRELSLATTAVVPSRRGLDVTRDSTAAIRGQMVAIQEELDWEVYQAYGLIEDDLSYSGDELPAVALGERAFEIVLARRSIDGVGDTVWFNRHESTPRTDLPEHWSEEYRSIVEKRIALIESNRFIRLLESPEHKRRWATEPWRKFEERLLREWLLDLLEDKRYWFDRAGRPTPRSIATLADVVSRDDEISGVLALWEGRPDVPVLNSLEKLLTPEAVPYLAAYRYKDSGLRKRAEWERVWHLQRKEDDKTYNQATDGPIPVPPKYTTADFRKTDYWRHRGKLDVPKERFIAYPDAGRETDPTLVIGWAGWDHAQQALALATLVQLRESEGASEERLIPLVAGLVELLPWVKQWHDNADPLYGGGSPAEFFIAQVDSRAAQLARTPEQLAAWRPPQAKRGRRTKAGG
ncbi:BREX-2 system adenine-specific DNA-methyltransferase PglX [Kribbella qitaiheensis]|uniref:BREX-2 system adenine-specific DNA-methyltransferase PglX n=1 Tax=Kribbella qitaiheensis TaxID=1544730 RepID=UPI0036146320